MDSSIWKEKKQQDALVVSSWRKYSGEREGPAPRIGTGDKGCKPGSMGHV